MVVEALVLLEISLPYCYQFSKEQHSEEENSEKEYQHLVAIEEEEEEDLLVVEILEKHLSSIHQESSH